MTEQRDPITVVRPSERIPGPPTAGMNREQAFATEVLWAGLVRTEPGMTSGWHHHGDYETTIYVLTGVLTMEFGPGGAHSITAQPGDFVRVPKGAVHRESNPHAEASDLVVVRAGRGESTMNVDGPEEAASQPVT